MRGNATLGERWIRLLRSYAPVPENEAQQAERVDRVARNCGIERIQFQHPWRNKLIEGYNRESGLFPNTVLTGTAGDGKTALCFELMHELGPEATVVSPSEHTITCQTSVGERVITLILDATAWRRREGSFLAPSSVALIERLAASVFGESDEAFVMAVNDGQMHELFRQLPPTVSERVVRLRNTIIDLHAKNKEESDEHLRLLNLSKVSSEELMRLSLSAVLDRPEWSEIFAAEGSDPLFSETSSIRRNYELLCSDVVQGRIATLARVADSTGYHLPIRGILCLISNALLGHPDGKGGVLRADDASRAIQRRDKSYCAALHVTLFGGNLSAGTRAKREIYRFLERLRAGEETTNELDELIVFGSFDQELSSDYEDLVRRDDHNQRSPAFDQLIRRYIQGDITSDDENRSFLKNLALDRRRLFLSGSPAQVKKHSLWSTTVFQHAGDYLDEVVNKVQKGEQVKRAIVRKLVVGLNRIWTGLLVSESTHELFLTTGLDVTSSPISDVFLYSVDIDGHTSRISLRPGGGGLVPELVIECNGKSFPIELTLPRYEFLSRVADGSMPSSFSKERSADFISLKTACLSRIGVQPSQGTLSVLSLDDQGGVKKQEVLVLS